MSGSNGELPLVLMPGMGTDARLFDDQRPSFKTLITPDWLDPQPRESLRDYGRRMVDALPVEPPYVLGGVSFGGMLALEMARHAKPRGVVLIASCRSRAALPLRLRLLARWGPLLPDFVADARRVVPAFMYQRVGATRDEHFERCHQMLLDTPPHLLRWTGRAIHTWPGAEDLDVPVYHVHGDADKIILSNRVRADAWIEGGGHLLTMSHVEHVNEAIARAMDRFEGPH